VHLKQLGSRAPPEQHRITQHIVYCRFMVSSAIELREIRVFLTLADELHFARAADLLYLTTSNVSHTIRSLERKIGGRLFDRTSRRVTLTPLGEDLKARITPSYQALVEEIAQTQEAAAGVAGLLRIGFTANSDGPELNRLTQAFQSRHDQCEIKLQEVENADPYRLLRRGLVDVLVNWLVVQEPDLTAGPTIGHRTRVLAVALDHRLAGCDRVSLEELAAERVCKPAASYPVAVSRAISPTHTPAGRPIPRVAAVRTSNEIVADVARGQMVHLTMAGVVVYQRKDIALIPMSDMAPLPLGLIWVTGNDSAKTRALAQTARDLGHRPIPAAA
jgi:DNA-binding transcriptional LysR family regulator